MPLRKKPFKDSVGKRENAGNQYFLLFPQCFLSFPKEISIFELRLFCRLQLHSIWTSLEFCCLVKREGGFLIPSQQNKRSQRFRFWFRFRKQGGSVQRKGKEYLRFYFCSAKCAFNEFFFFLSFIVMKIHLFMLFWYYARLERLP